MEALTRLVAESFARHGFDRPLDYRRLHWSRWFPCESPHSLLFVPSKPGVFALAEEVAPFCGASEPRRRHPERSEGSPFCHPNREGQALPGTNREGHDFCRAENAPNDIAALAAEGISIADGGHRAETARRMLAVLQFCEDDDMAFVLDRMFSRQNPMRARLLSGSCFVRFVVLEDPVQRRSICNALNQWLISSSETATGIGAHFASSLELSSATAATTDTHVATGASPVPRSGATGSGSELDLSASRSTPMASQLDSGAATNIHSPTRFPSGF